MPHPRLFFLCTLLLFAVTGGARADTVLAAVAANFGKPMRDIAQAFQETTGHRCELAFAASGKFVSQLGNGAPFQVFLSADQANAQKLEQSGLAVPGSRFTYAVGKLVLWSATPSFVDEDGQVLAAGRFKHLAIADPKLAPYGAAALQVLRNRGLLETLEPLLVQGENIAQTYEFISTGNAELGFVALSQVADNGKIASGSGWEVPDTLYSPILQDALLLKTGEKNPAATALLAFLKTERAKAVIEKYGYALP